MVKLLLLLPALLINVLLFALMYYLVAAEPHMPNTMLPPLQLQSIELPDEAPQTETAEPLPSLPEMPEMPAAASLPPAATTSLPPVPELPALPELELPEWLPTPPQLELDKPLYLGEMAVPEPSPAPKPPAPILPPTPASPNPVPQLAPASSTAQTAQSAAPVTSPAPKNTPKRPRIVQADRQLLVLLKNKPSYPRLARRRGIEGKVEVEFLINTQGAVEQAKVIFSEPPGQFEKAALQAVRSWKFAPRYINGEAVYQRAQQVIDFKLR